MADVFGLTKAEGRLLQLVIDHVRSHGYDVPNERQRRYPVQYQEMGKLDQAVTKGALSAPNNIVSVWEGPAHGVDDADNGLDIEADYSLGDFDAGDYVLVTLHRGKFYVSCLGAPT